MDVIALHQAGFGGAVAPCGTALTTGQLEELWRLSDAPVLCFDGDAAGARAAARAAEVALPMIAPDRTLCLATLPAGEDPDTLVRRGGAGAFDGVLAGKRPLAVALFDLLREGFAADTPEARAALRARLDAAAARITDKSLASEYRSALRERFYASTRRQNGKVAPRVMAAPRATPGDATVGERHRFLLAILLRHPALIHDVDEALSQLPLSGGYGGMRDAILDWHHSADVLDSGDLMNHLTASGFAVEAELLLSGRAMPLPIASGLDAMPAEAETAWWHFFQLLNKPQLDEQIAAARADFNETPSTVTQERLVTLTAARLALLEDAAVDDAEA